MNPLHPIAVTLALILLLWCWATFDAPEPVPLAAYIVPVVLAGLLVGVLLALFKTMKKQ